ncbi:flagellar hook-associated protein FlgK [Gimesia aquarii]|uniref:Flagellar hook-associated protein 1 n=1 Tax=Gimesia aquarii TaxID=2527964 RepID=A0A517W2F1_9PLAN|nr:flagellar hook-associated protein FlgK [Gimesia aquarii]QDT99433.1 flagellar hook-associated protein FlgK [Gimesia aquarii]
MGLNATLAMAKQSLEMFGTGIQVAGQNISNAGTPGYIREEMVVNAADPYRQGALVLGTGAEISGIQQQIDLFLETRIHSANTDYSSIQERNLIYKQLEGELRELSSGDLSTGLNDFLATINNVVNQPSSIPDREFVINEAEKFAAEISSLRLRVNELREVQSVNVENLVKEANELIDTIIDLNPKISRLEASGLLQSDAGGLRTQRYTALNRLSELVPIRYRERTDGAIDVFTGSDFLVLAGTSQKLTLQTDTDRGVVVHEVSLSQTNSTISRTGGELKGIIEGRDDILGGFVDELDTYASNLIFEFNKIHASGQGTAGFEQLTSASRALDPAATLNSTQSGLPFQPTHGSFEIKVTNKTTGITNTSTINVDLDGIGADSTLNSISAAIGGVANLNSTVTTDGHLTITASPDFEFQFANDTSGALATIGINTLFTGSDSSDIQINSVIMQNQQFLATGQGGGPSDGSNAVLLAAFAENPIDALGGINLDGYYEKIVGNIAQSSASEAALSEGAQAFRDSLLGQREQFSGVSIDEETIKVLTFQRAFQSAARLVSTVDELFTILLNI